MSEQPSIQISHGIEVLQPTKGNAYPIPCEEWEHIRNQVQQISMHADKYHTIGVLLLGAGVTTLFSSILGSYAAAHIGYSVSSIAIICGLTSLLFASESKAVTSKSRQAVADQMDLIESRFKSAQEYGAR